MGLDICLHKFEKVNNPDRVYAQEEVVAMSGKWVHTFAYCSDSPQKPIIKGLDPSFIFRLKCKDLSYRKMLEAAGKNPDEGVWHDGGGGTSPWGEGDLHGDKIKASTPNGDKADWWILLIQKKDLDSADELDRVWIPIFKDNIAQYEVEVEKWVGLTHDYEYGYMRKGANAKFYEDGMWGSQIVCSKEILKEHMEKYFDKKSDGRYASPYNEFKSEIYDKFEDGKGMFVVYC